jgi:hypothetical protein
MPQKQTKFATDNIIDVSYCALIMNSISFQGCCETPLHFYVVFGWWIGESA